MASTSPVAGRNNTREPDCAAWLTTARLEFTISKVLQAQVDTQVQVLTEAWRLQKLEVFDVVTQPVSQHFLLARLTTQRIIKRKLSMPSIPSSSTLVTPIKCEVISPAG